MSNEKLLPSHKPVLPPWIITSIAICVLLMRIVYAFTLRFSNDETQHLHVVWGWTRGGVQYRDFFDNHSPLFHILFAPLLVLAGERPDSLSYMRIGMIPIYFACVWCFYKIGTSLLSRRAGLVAAFIGALWPSFFLGSLRFRTD